MAERNSRVNTTALLLLARVFAPEVIARAANVSELIATVLANNHQMPELLSHAELPQTQSRDGDVIDLRLSLRP